MEAVLTTLGIVIFVIGLLFSIAWHELGHLSTAKLFGIKVTQYMVGFGKTLWSTKRGDTEYGIKAIPMGGYIRMVGMIPPGDDGKLKQRSSSPWRAMIEDARQASFEDLEPGDEKRLFYTRRPWKRVIVMAAGPVMNLILAIGLFSVVLMGFGQFGPTTVVGVVSECAVPAAEAGQDCPDDAPPTPAAEVGLRPGDRIVSMDGRPIESWTDLQQAIRGLSGPTEMQVVRGGETLTLTPSLISNQVVELDEYGNPVEGSYVEAGFLGIVPTYDYVRLSPAAAAETMAGYVGMTFDALIELPSRIPGLWGAAFQGEERDLESPVGIVGASRIGGEILAQEIPVLDRALIMVNLLAAFNLSLFLFNMIPLLPMDGGHIAGALWESVRRWTARLFRRPDPGPFDVAKLMPVAYVVAIVFIAFSLLVLVADIVNPIRLVQ
ncbi:M50 family metallopeptidase [Allonocardiopsis opalescens]|uniref:RIP metalloprotease RseP n=1 Tax=Allonocardiopsis opalescens TaxID=1144618 RepID=A0A2T0PVG1_9ACTN|nr:site-2 protease family protein [Allonocardiopsis opalescens]PRX95524.1 RIP metalloprotease RseP [Allonocardiopsis opalescens]